MTHRKSNAHVDTQNKPVSPSSCAASMGPWRWTTVSDHSPRVRRRLHWWDYALIVGVQHLRYPHSRCDPPREQANDPLRRNSYRHESLGSGVGAVRESFRDFFWAGKGRAKKGNISRFAIKRKARVWEVCVSSTCYWISSCIVVCLISQNQFSLCRITSASSVQRSDNSWKPAFEGFNDARLAEVVEAFGRNSSGSSVSATTTRTDTTKST